MPNPNLRVMLMNHPQGELTFGCVDRSKITGPVDYVPVTKALIAGKYWGIDQFITYGDTVIQVPGSGIVDTGTTLLLLNSGKHTLRVQM